MDTSAKLAQVKKSCNVLEIVFKVFKIVCIVGACICLVASIGFAIVGNRVVSFNNGSGPKINVHFFDNDILSYENGKLSGPFAGIIEEALEDSIEDNLGIQGHVNLSNVLEGEYGPVATDLLNGYVRWGTFVALLCGALFACAVAFVFYLIEGIFKEIKDSESPFTEAILKKLRIAFILISVLALLGNGLWAGAITGLICWAVYCIIDYGYALQSEVDETL